MRWDDGDTSQMARRTVQSVLLVVLSVAAAMYFVVFPLWDVEHPTDASLVLHRERHLLWHGPLHAHVDAAAMAIPILAIAIVATALLMVISHNGE